MPVSIKPKLHLLCFDVPAPPDNGGAIDLYYKIKSLHEVGVAIYLHCFQYGRSEALELQQWCSEVWYYPRQTGFRGFSFSQPYIVSSRFNMLLLKRLLEVDAPILFDGLHTTACLRHSALQRRWCALRVHNIESEYYRELSRRETRPIHRLYLSWEAWQLRRYERLLTEVSCFFALSTSDLTKLSAEYPEAQHVFVPPFHPYTHVESKSGSGTFLLYHGNLAHPENIEAVQFLLREVAPYAPMPLVFAGRNPNKRLVRDISRVSRCSLVNNPSADALSHLLANAHAHLLPTFQATGMKLKLLYALYQGRHVIANQFMLQGTGLESICHVANEPDEWRQLVNSICNQTFNQSDISRRNDLLGVAYNNLDNARRLLTYLQPKSL